jgi:hypothetical protein
VGIPVTSMRYNTLNKTITFLWFIDTVESKRNSKSISNQKTKASLTIVREMIPRM